jgi:hypothetical protein
LKELSSVAGIPATDLIQIIKGGIPHLQGTWVHPQVAINLAQWLSPKFAVQVSKWVLDWLSGKNQNQSKIPYHLERYMANMDKIPQGYFSMLNEMTQNLIAPLEKQGYTLPENMIPDISEGRMFSDWIRKNTEIEPRTFPTYRHTYENGKMVDARLYPNHLLAHFRKHFYEVWIQQHSIKYFEDRDIKSLPALSNVIKLLNGIKIEPYSIEKSNNEETFRQIDNQNKNLNNPYFEKDLERFALAKPKKKT